MEEKEECPNCLGTGEVYSRRTKKGIECNICNGNGEVESIIAEAYLHESIPSMDM